MKTNLNDMKQTRLLSVVLVLFAISQVARASAPEMINYQGYLKQDGVVVNAVKNMSFAMYDALTGGAQLCATGMQAVTVTNGLFSYKIGESGCNLSAINWSNPVYLEVSVDGTPLSPRELLTGTSYLVQHRATDIILTPAGDVAATNVQSAVAELDTEKISKSGGAMSGTLYADAGIISAGNITLATGTIAAATATFYTLTSITTPGNIITAGNITAATGTVTAAHFSGDGSALTGINASALDHNTMGNLTTGDPHTQYAKKTGDTMTGTLYANTGIITAGNITAATGTITAQAFSGDGAGLSNVGTAAIADNSVATGDVAFNFVGSLNGVVNKGGNVQFVDGGGVSIVADDTANTITLSASASAVDHNSLSNLTVGDFHTQYFKKAGDTVSGQITSTYGAGAPFVITSNTVNANLNADLLDGQEAAAFMTAATDNWVNTTGDTMAGALILNNAALNMNGANGDIVFDNAGGTISNSAGAVQINDDLNISGAAAVAINSAATAISANQTGAGDLLHLQKNGTDMFVVDPAGNLGIGGAPSGLSLYARGNLFGEYPPAGPVTTANVDTTHNVTTRGDFGLSNGDQHFRYWWGVNFDIDDGAAAEGAYTGVNGANNEDFFNVRWRNGNTDTYLSRFTVVGGSGRVGIGTITPANLLDVEGSAAIGASYSGTNAAPANGLIVEGNVGIGKNNPATALDVNGTVTATAFVGGGAGLTGVIAAGAVAKTGDVMTGGLVLNSNSATATVEINNPTGAGVTVHFKNTAATATVYAENSNAAGYGVLASNTNATSGNAGWFQNTNAGNASSALVGTTPGTAATAFGVEGFAAGAGTGVYGRNNGAGYGVFGVNSNNGTVIGGNHTGGSGNLVKLQQGGVDKFVVSYTGAVTATSFSGDGSALTGIAAATDHNSLANLTVGDPHTQYFKKAGDSITGTMSATANNGGSGVNLRQDGSGETLRLGRYTTAGTSAMLVGDTNQFVPFMNFTQSGNPRFFVNYNGNIYASGTISAMGGVMNGALGIAAGAATATMSAYQNGNANAAGYFTINSAGNATNTVFLSTVGTGNLMGGNHSGAGGNLIQLQSGGVDRFVVDKNGLVTTGSFNDNTKVLKTGDVMTGGLVLNANSSTATVEINNPSGAGVTAHFKNAAATATVYAENSNAAGFGAYVLNTNNTSGNAGWFGISNAGNASSALVGTTPGTAATAFGVQGFAAGAGSGVTGGNNGAGFGVFGVNSNNGTVIGGDHQGGSGYLIRMKTGGVDKFVVDYSGNAGMGTASPTVKMNISPDAGQYGLSVGRVALKPNIILDSAYGMIDTDGVNGLWLNYYTNKNVILAYGGGNVGIGATPVNKLDVEGGVAIGATYSGTSAAPANGLIVEGSVGIGIAAPTNKLHVENTAASGNGAYFTTSNTANNTGQTVYSLNDGGTGSRAGYFENNNAANTACSLWANNTGGGEALCGSITNAANGSDAIKISTDGDGRAASFSVTKATNSDDTVYISHAGGGSGTTAGLEVETTNGAHAIYGHTGGTSGRAGKFMIDNNGNDDDVLYLSTASNVGGTTVGRLIDTNKGAYLTNTGIWTDASSRKYKKDITPLTQDDARNMLDVVNGIQVVRYRYKGETPSRKMTIGVIAEDAPDEMTDDTKTGVQPVKAVGMLIAATQAQQELIDESKREIETLKSEIDELKNEIKALKDEK